MAGGLSEDLLHFENNSHDLILKYISYVTNFPFSINKSSTDALSEEDGFDIYVNILNIGNFKPVIHL